MEFLLNLVKRALFMAATKNQFKRLEILDELFGRKKCTQEELLSYINDKLSDDGKAIDKRTLFRDIKYLIEEKGAPVHRPEKGDEFYYYTAKFSIRNVPLDEDDVAILKKAISVLKQVENFQMMEEVEEVIRKLENRVHTRAADQTTILQFEKHTTSSGQEYFDNLLDAIEAKVPIKIFYQPYIYTEPLEKNIHPYLLKEFRNRWFLIGREANTNYVNNYALDRIKKIKNSDSVFVENDLFDPDHYFDSLIGVSVPRGAQPETIQIKVYKKSVPYIISKPIHHNQQVLKENKDGSMVVELNLIINFEFKSILLSYGAGVEIKKPLSLRKEMSALVKEMQALYTN
jgi:predicted DNA-binding transcriptional regulator YafY